MVQGVEALRSSLPQLQVSESKESCFAEKDSAAEGRR